MVDRKRLLHRSSKRVQADEHDEGERRGGEVLRRGDAQDSREEQHGRDEQQRVESAVHEPVVSALCDVEQGLDLRDSERTQIGFRAEALGKRRPDRR